MKKIIVFFVALSSNVLYPMDRPDSFDNLSGNAALISVKFSQVLDAKGIYVSTATLDTIAQDLLGRTQLIRSADVAADIADARSKFDGTTDPFLSAIYLARLNALKDRYHTEGSYILTIQDITNIIDRAVQLCGGRYGIDEEYLRRAIRELRIDTKSEIAAQEARRAAQSSESSGSVCVLT